MRLTSGTSITLNLIRGVSAQLVFIGHLLSFYGIYGKPGQFNIQNFGVVIFFILSGFLISYSIDNKDAKYNYTEYVFDRAIRIFISYIPALLVILALDFLSFKLTNISDYSENIGLSNFIGNLFMLQDFPLFEVLKHRINSPFNVTSLGSGRPLWTVAIEWWIYLFFGFLFLKKISFKNIAFLCFLLLVPLFNIGGRGNGLTILWFSGVLVYFSIKKNVFVMSRNNSTLGVVVVLIIACLMRLFFNANGFDVYDLGFSLLIAMIFCLIVSFTQNHHVSRLIRMKELSHTLSAYSFSLYLIHYSIIVFVINFHFNLNAWFQMAVIFITGNFLSWIFARSTEYRYHELRGFLKRRFL